MLFKCAKLDKKRHRVIKGQIILRQAIQVKQKRERSLRWTEEIQEGFMGAARPLGPTGVWENCTRSSSRHTQAEGTASPWNACIAEGRGLGITMFGGHQSLETVVRVKFQNQVLFLIKMAFPGPWLHCFFSISI